MPSHDEMVRTVERYVEAFDKNDAAMAADLYATDATVEDPIGTPIHRGRDAIHAFYAASMQANAKLRLDGPVRTGGDYAAFAFTVLVDFGGPKEIEVIDTFKFDAEGKVMEMRAYWNPANMRDTAAA
ncbi:nuclear transport factor 2 family protein [Sphingopyxis witflariensis]|uniref:Steroid delta-isomerase n=1 Tax=Sphingopyxis witflariensis TaxID=173675 RepID=A0A246JJQ5_9SPHN|nr:nuclear transport factor 2 family protein [Sphingopyxis witflariensis]OWQ92874.1 steroid delta-isomerase [Sphingopyxis witflariensis]